MLFCGFLSGAGVYQWSSTFWDGTQSLVEGDHATIPHLKEDSHSFHMTPNAKIFITKIGLLQANSHSNPAKPRTLRCPRTMMKLSGLMSAWIMRRRWMNCTASSICIMKIIVMCHKFNYFGPVLAKKNIFFYEFQDFLYVTLSCSQ